MKIKKEAAVAIFAGLGITTAPKWTETRMNAKLNKLNEMVDEDTEFEPAVQKDADKVLAAIEKGTKVEVAGGAAKPPAKKAPAKGKKAPAKKAPAKGKKAPAKKDAEKAAEPEAPKTPGVREMPTRAFYAGQVITKHGLEAGVTQDMVAEVDELYGKDNPVESLYRLRDAWHAIRAYVAAQ
jgi:hypothetical protein